MNIEITNTNFQNKGSELMLRAIVSAIVINNRDAKCVIQPWNAPYIKRAEIGLYQRLNYQKYKIDWSNLIGNLPQRFLKQYGIINEKDIDIIFDASGFQYSDQWGLSFIKPSVLYYQKAKKRNTKLILLPQAFGPFNNKEVNEEFKKIVDIADLIFARDDVSFNNLTKTYGALKKIKLAPDFTNLLEVNKISLFPDKKAICIMPNQRMLDKTDKKIKVKYLEIVSEIIQQFLASGAYPFFLIHELTTDKDIIRTINENFSIPIIEEPNPIRIKGIIGGCYAVLGSRFHGLVSALSQGIPSICIGWSHKYNMLLKDYKCEELMIDLNNNINLDLIINKIMSTNTYDQLKYTITIQSIEQKKNAANMWSQIFNFINDSK
jgi:polysaccharide pyruvyl transferase WcaK-like protein